MYTATELSPRRTQKHGSFAKAPSTSGRSLDRLRVHPRPWTRNVQYSGALRSLTAAAAAPEVLASIEAAPMGNTAACLSNAYACTFACTSGHTLQHEYQHTNTLGFSDDLLDVPNLRHRLLPRPSPFTKSNNYGGGFGEEEPRLGGSGVKSARDSVQGRPSGAVLPCDLIARLCMHAARTEICHASNQSLV